MLKILTPIFSLVLFLGIPLAWSQSDTTLNDDYFFTTLRLDPSVRFDDGTCGSGFTRFCCHSEVRYNCKFLMDQFAAGYCRPNRKDKRRRSWKKCQDLPALPVTQEALNRLSQPVKGTSLMRPTGATTYAADLTACAAYGRRQAYRYARRRGLRSGAGHCAVGVRTALACMARKRGQRVNNMNFHCGGSAGHYYGCLEKKGFVRHSPQDTKACNTPGVVRVYHGYRQGKRRRRVGMIGDVHGHIEFLGTDGMWHAGIQSSLPIDTRLNSKGFKRRILKGCYIYTGDKR